MTEEVKPKAKVLTTELTEYVQFDAKKHYPSLGIKKIIGIHGDVVACQFGEIWLKDGDYIANVNGSVIVIDKTEFENLREV